MSCKALFCSKIFYNSRNIQTHFTIYKIQISIQEKYHNENRSFAIFISNKLDFPCVEWVQNFSEATRDIQCQGFNAMILGLIYVIPSHMAGRVFSGSKNLISHSLSLIHQDFSAILHFYTGLVLFRLEKIKKYPL